MANEAPSRLLMKLGGLLKQGPEGVFFAPEDREKLLATVELGARLPPQKSIPAIMDIVRFMMALRQEGHTVAADTVEEVLKGSGAAMQVINRVAEVDKEMQAKQLGASPTKLPASVEQLAKAQGGLTLKDLLPPGGVGMDRARAGAPKPPKKP